MQSTDFHPHTALPRWLPGCAALAVSLGSFAVLLAAFDSASPREWLVPTPSVKEMVARCDVFTQRAQREACMQTVVAVLIEHRQRAVTLAQR